MEQHCAINPIYMNDVPLAAICVAAEVGTSERRNPADHGTVIAPLLAGREVPASDE